MDSKEANGVSLCDPYVWQDPRFLFRTNKNRGVCASELVNQVIFVYIFAILCGFLLSVYTNVSSAPMLAALGASVYLIPTFVKLRAIQEKFANPPPIKKNKEPEGFANKEADEVAVRHSNPFNNILVYPPPGSGVGMETPTKPLTPLSAGKKSKSELDNFFRVQWYSDPTDVFGKSQDQRMFITQPVTTVPNDQESYQNWLYKIPGDSCKQGGAKNCHAGTNGSAIPWLNM